MTKVINTGSATHTGLVRSHNEDAIVSLPEQGLFVVADGMGGQAGGRDNILVVVVIPA